VKRVGILYHPRLGKARDLASKLGELLSAQGVGAWECSAWDEDNAKSQVTGSDLILSIGGDGTILHVARIITPLPVPILGINLGRLGFMSDLRADEALPQLPRLLDGEGWIEERAMLQAQLQERSFHALNDVVVRSTAVRLVNTQVKIDGRLLGTYRADGVIVATATGSTGYSLAAGGPILDPQSKELILQPISCHLGLSHSLVLPAQSTVNLKLVNEDRAILSIDGQIDLPLPEEQDVEVRLSPYLARFLKLDQPGYFYTSLWHKLSGKE